ncbi:MAG: hypothetical protein M3Q87_01835 [Actinomycetota bacterium]|nr:hypothetical protein [Actinomycetota bacterium]
MSGEEPGLQPDEDMQVTEPCPAELTAAQLTGKVELGSADIDGDRRVDPVVMGTVPAGDAGCRVAVVATTASGTVAAPVAGAREAVGPTPLAAPTFAQVDGAAGDEIVVTTSWSPRGGGTLAMFSWVDGELVQVQQAGRPWELFATVDDGGGLPQLLTCLPKGFARVTAYPPGLDAGSTVTSYALADGVLTVRDREQDRTATYQQVKRDYPMLPRAGVAVLPDCG